MSISLMILADPRLLFVILYLFLVLAIGLLAIVHAFHPFDFKKGGRRVVFFPSSLGLRTQAEHLAVAAVVPTQLSQPEKVFLELVPMEPRPPQKMEESYLGAIF